RWRRHTGQSTNHRPADRQKGDQRGNWISRQSEKYRALQRADGDWLAGLDCDLEHMQSTAQRLNECWKMISIPCRNSASRNEDVRPFILTIERVRKLVGHVGKASEIAELHPWSIKQSPQHESIRIEDLSRFEGFTWLEQFGTGGEKRNLHATPCDNL